MNSSISSSRRAIALFFLGAAATLLLVASASEFLLRREVLPRDSFAAHAALFRAAGAADAAFGDSHMARDFAPPPAMLNLAYPSESVRDMDWKARRVFARTAPGRIVLQADPHSFAPYRLEAQSDPARRYAEDGGGAIHLFDPRLRPQLMAYWGSFLWSGFTLRSRERLTEQGALLSPGDLSLRSPRRLLYEARARMREHRPVADPGATPDGSLYRALVEELVGRGARVCLVTMPLSPAYLQAMAERPDRTALLAWGENVAWFGRLAAETGARHVDHRRAVTDPALFRDVDHLNGTGALAYSPLVMRDCFGASE
ncbi:MAG: hypothetical protein AB7R90_20950 [Reyranellaceae bacterium]